MRFNELTEEPSKDDGSLPIIKAFVDFACDRIGLERPPKIKLVRNPKLASQRRSFGGYMPGGGIEITIGNRHIMDVLRTLAHELVHHKQDVDGRLNDDSGKDGSEHENEANAKAAIVMRLWGKMNPELFQRAALLAESQIRQRESILVEGTIEERRRKKRRVRGAAYGPGPYGWYGYDAGYSGDSGGGDGGGESIQHENWDDEEDEEKIVLVKSLKWPELVNKVNSAMKAMGWKGQRKDDGSFMFSTRGQLDDEWYIVVIDNRGNNMFTYALGTVEEGDPHIGEQESLPMTEASVSELMNAIREGFGLNEQGLAENFADGRNPQDKGDSKRHGVPTKASVSTLRNVAKQGGRKGQLAHWMANMKSGKAKKK
jgi:hypothetical protein